MMRRGPVWVGGIAVSAAILAGCAPGAGTPAEGALRLRYEAVLAPEAYSRDGPAIPDGPEGAAGFWAAAPGLPRPERGLVENPATGAEVQVALFAGGAPGGAIRLSGAAAEAIGLAAPGRVRVTALRREPRLTGR